MILLAEAELTAGALKSASIKCPIRQIQYELDGRAEEWERAIIMLRDVGDEGVIEMCSSVSRGMRVAHDRYGWSRVLRKLNDGMSLHCESGDSPAGFYRNFLDPTSPVVVKA